MSSSSANVIQRTTVVDRRTTTTPSNSETLNLNYQSPQEAFNDAINYTESDNDNMGTNDRKMERMMSNMLQSVNDSKYIYPTIAIIVISILVILVLFQKISAGIKLLAIVLLILFIAFTVFLNKN